MIGRGRRFPGATARTGSHRERVARDIVTDSAGEAGAAAGRWATARTLDGAKGAVAAYVGSLVVYGLQSLAVSLRLGRDAEDYLIHGWELLERDPLFPLLMLARTPVAGIVFVVLDWIGGTTAIEVGLGLIYAAGVTCWVAAARAYGRGAAVTMFVLLAVVPAFGLFHHRVSSDPIFAAVLGLVALLAVRLSRRPSAARAAALGSAIGLLVLVRPSGQPFVLLALVPLVGTAAWRARLVRAATVACVAVVLVGAWAVTNGLRFGEYTVAHGARAGVPLYRVFVVDPTVARDNGPASRAVAAVVERRLIGLEPYRSYGFDADEVLGAGSTWVFDDVVRVVEAEYGPRRGDDCSIGPASRRSAPTRGARSRVRRSASSGCYCSPTLRRSTRAPGSPPRRIRSTTPCSDRRAEDADCRRTSRPTAPCGPVR